MDGRVASGDGPSHDGDLEQRVGDLERRMDRVETKLDTIIDMLADLRGEMRHLPASVRADIKHLPSKGFVISTVIGIVGLVIAAIALAPYLRAAT